MVRTLLLLTGLSLVLAGCVSLPTRIGGPRQIWADQARQVRICSDEIDRMAGIQWRQEMAVPEVVERADNAAEQLVDLTLLIKVPVSQGAQAQKVQCTVSTNDELRVVRLEFLF